MDNIESYAALLEWQQAERDYRETFKAYNVDRVWASPLDYAVWSAAGYADSARTAYYDMDVSIG